MAGCLTNESQRRRDGAKQEPEPRTSRSFKNLFVRIDLALRVVEGYVGYDLTVQVADAIEYQGKGWLDANSNHAYAMLPAFTEENPVCPACMMKVSDRSITYKHTGKNYYFCSAADKETFEKHTDIFDRFLAEDAAAKSKSGI